MSAHRSLFTLKISLLNQSDSRNVGFELQLSRTEAGPEFIDSLPDFPQ